MNTHIMILGTSARETRTGQNVEMNRHDLGDLLRAARDRAGLKQGDVATTVGVGQTTISNWEGGKTEPSIADVYKFADACGQRAELRIVTRGAEAELAELVEAAQPLPNDDLQRLLRVARAIRGLPGDLSEVLTKSFEGVAEAHRR